MKRTLIVTVSALAAIGLSAGIAAASIPDSGGVIHACYQNPPPQHGANLQVIDTGNGGSCSGGMVALTWNQTGPQGPQGATGATGAQGPVGISGYQLITQSETSISCTGSGSVFTLSIPSGDVVLGAGIDASSGGIGNALDTANGPDLNDSTKWEFEANAGLQNGGCGTLVGGGITLWMAVGHVSS